MRIPKRRRSTAPWQWQSALRAAAVKFFHEGADDERRILRLLPRQDAENAGLHGQVQQGDADDGNENAARDVALGIANFAAEMADVVVAPIGVDGVDRRG